MRKIVTPAAAIAALIVLSLAPRAEAQCDNTLLGTTYAISLSGAVNGFRLAGAGQMIGDGNGGLTGSLTLSRNGHINQGTLTGSYNIVGNCVGTLRLLVLGFQAANFNIFLGDGGRSFFGAQTDFATSVTLEGKAF